jgi:hypothetical protein
MDFLYDATGADTLRRRLELQQIVTRIREALAPLQLYHSTDTVIALLSVALIESRVAALNWRGVCQMAARAYGVDFTLAPPDSEQPQQQQGQPLRHPKTGRVICAGLLVKRTIQTIEKRGEIEDDDKLALSMSLTDLFEEYTGRHCDGGCYQEETPPKPGEPPRDPETGEIIH